MERTFVDQLSEIVAARRFAACVVGDGSARLGDALVIVSELTSNAVRHAGTSFTLSVVADEEHIRIEVVDRGDGWPEPTADAPMPRNGGMGLHLVDALSDRWGVMERPHGKVVWAELDEDGGA